MSKTVDFVPLLCYFELSYTTDGISGIDHGEYSGKADRLGTKSLGVRRFCFLRRPPGNRKGLEL